MKQKNYTHAKELLKVLKSIVKPKKNFSTWWKFKIVNKRCHTILYYIWTCSRVVRKRWRAKIQPINIWFPPSNVHSCKQIAASFNCQLKKPNRFSQTMSKQCHNLLQHLNKFPHIKKLKRNSISTNKDLEPLHIAKKHKQMKGRKADLRHTGDRYGC